MKKIFLISFLTLFFLPLFPAQIQGAGLVPCGGFELDAKGNLIRQSLADPVPSGWKKISDSEMAKLEPVCQFCHFFVLFNNIIKFFLFDIVPALAALMIVIAGFYFFLAGQNPAMLTKAKEILTSTLWGLIIIFGAWVIVNMFFGFIGINEVDFKGLPGGWFQIKNCPLP